MKFSKLASIFLIIALILITLPTRLVHAATGPVCYVKTGASGSGGSWANAYPNLQSALADNNCSEIWVAQGTYYPDEGTGQTNNDRTSTFTLKNNVAIYGGFDGTETLRADRDWETNTTTLSGNIDQVSGNSSNAYHVVTGSGTDSTAILDGFTINAGNADAPQVYPADPHSLGGGMYSDNGNATLRNLIFYSNNALQGGGGLYTGAEYGVTGYSPTLDNVVFNMNTSELFGAGFYMGFVDTPGLIKNITFKNNTSLYEGGGMFITASSPTLEDITFENNTAGGGPEYAYADYRGGAMFISLGSNPNITNATFSSNSADAKGGAIFNQNDSKPTFTNATFTGNSATEAGGAIYNYSSKPTFVNVILWGNTAPSEPEIFDEYYPVAYWTSISTINDSIVKGGCPTNSV